MNKVFIFKIFEVGLGSGIDLVKRMQFEEDMDDVWIMFNYVKCVKLWTNMDCHIYNLTYCCVNTIIVCNMQSEDMAA